MLTSIIGLDLWSVWQPLSVLNKTFALLFCGVSFYSLFVSLHVLLTLHSLKKTATKRQSENTRLKILRKRLWNLRQLHLSSLYLLGFCIAIQVPDVFRALALSYDIPFLTITRTFGFLFYFDAAIFIAFLLIHSVQWFVSVRLDSRLNSD